MTVEDYIASGVLEIYAVGGLTPAEQAEVEKMLQKHPKIKAELNRIESALLAYANTYKSQPPLHLKNEILNKIYQVRALLKNLNGKEQKFPLNDN